MAEGTPVGPVAAQDEGSVDAAIMAPDAGTSGSGSVSTSDGDAGDGDGALVDAGDTPAEDNAAAPAG